MSITKTIITAIVGLTLVAVIAPVAANALTTAELQAQINALMAQLSQLQGTTTTTGTSSAPAVCAGVTFTRNLTTGATGSDVKCLQAVLNQTASTQVATTGAGSPGNETTYFGPATLRAVRAFQTANGMTPANQVGPMTRAKLNQILAGSVTVTPVVPGVVTPTGAGLSVMLASDNPASGAVVSNAALVPLAKLTLVNGDNAQVKVTGVKLNRIGVSADASLNNVYLFDGANRLTDAASVSSGVISFNDSNGIFTVDSNGSKTITVYADLAASSGETLGVALTSASNVTSNASSVKGNFPLNGNLMTVATATLAGVNFNNSTTPSEANVNPAKDQVVWENLTSVTTRSVIMSWIRLREIGTINYSDVNNYRLYVDGVQVGAAVANLDANGYVTFDLTSSPVTLQTGTRDIKVLADIIAGSSRKYSFSLRVAADVSVKDTQYGSNILAQANSTTFSARTTGDQTINSGTITLQKTTDSPAGNVTNLASNQVLGRFTLTAAGERVKVDTLTVTVVSSKATVGCLRNGAIFANGVQIGSTSDLYTSTNTTCGTGTPSSKAFTLGSSLIVDPASPVKLEVRADLYDNDGTNHLAANDTLQVRINTGSANGQGQVSLTTSNVPASNVTANQLTVKTGSLTLSKYTAYTNSNAVVPLTNFKLSHFTLSNDTVEPVNVSSIKVTLNYVSGTASNLYVQYGTQKTTTTTTVSAASTTYSVNYQLAPSTTIDVAVYADINSSALGQATSGVYITGTTANSATAVPAGTDADATTGQTITFTTGSVTTAFDSTPKSAAVAGNQTVPAANFQITAANDSYTIQEVKVAVANAATSAVALNAILKDGNTVLGTQPFSATSNTEAYFTGLNLAVPANTTKVLTVELSLSQPSADYSTTGKNAKITLSYVKVANSQGVTSEPTANRAGNYLYVYKSVPTFTLGGSTISAATIAAQNPANGGTLPMYSFTVAADPKGDIALKQLKFLSTVTDASGSSNPLINTLKFFRGSDDITDSVTIQNIYAGSLESTAANVSGSNQTIIVTFDTEEKILANTSYNYILKGNFSSFAYSTSGGDAVSVSMPTDSDSTAGGSNGAAQTHFYTYNASANTGIQQLATAAAGTSADDANIIWSDKSAVGHSYTYNASSADWFNGYLIKNLALDSIGQSAR